MLRPPFGPPDGVALPDITFGAGLVAAVDASDRSDVALVVRGRRRDVVPTLV